MITNMFTQNNRYWQQGYIALISSVIISLVLTGLAYMVARSGFFARFDSLNAEYKRISKGMAESCANEALLALAQDPDIDSVAFDNDEIGCSYRIDSTGYDSEHKKVSTITASAHYPEENGAYSTMRVNSTVYDPQHSAPSRIVVNAYSYGEGAKAVEDFGPFEVDGTEVELGVPTVFESSQTYTITEEEDDDYRVSYSGDCNSSGDIDLGVNDYQTCNIVNTLKPQTASVTVIISSADGTLPGKLIVDGQAVDNPAAKQQFTLGPEDGVTGDRNDFIISVDAVDGYNISDWAGSTDDSGGQLCSGDFDDGTLRVKKGDNIVCAIALAKQSPPPDTVIMLDRTLSMFGNNSPYYNNHPEWIQGERDAAKSLLDLYATASIGNYPKVGIGHFGADDDWNAFLFSYASAEMLSDITNNEAPAPYGDRTSDTGLYRNITTGTSSGSKGGTNLYAAITKAQEVFPEDGNAHSIVIVSDGEPNHCLNNYNCNSSNAKSDAADAADAAKDAGTEIYAIHFGDTDGQTFLAGLATNSSLDHFLPADTGFLSPTRQEQNATGDFWTNQTGAYSSGGTAAFDDSGNRQRYYDFNIPSLSGRPINGIEVKATAWTAGGDSADTGYKSPSLNTADSGGDNDGFEVNPSNAYANGGGIAKNINGAGDRHQYYGYDFGLPANAIITGVEVRLDWWLDSSWGTNSTSIQLSSDGGSSWTAAFATENEFTSESTAILGGAGNLWGRSWTVADLGSGFRVRAISNSSSSTRDFYLDWIPVKVYYRLPFNSACQLGVDLSWYRGNVNTWSEEKVAILTDTAATYYYGGGIDKWGNHLWQASDLADDNLRVRVHYIDPDPGSNDLCADGASINLDWLQIKVYYQGNQVDATAENADGDHFYISPTSAEMEDIFQTIGEEIMAPAVGELPPVLVVVTQTNNASGTANNDPGDFELTIKTNGLPLDAVSGSETGQLFEFDEGDDWEVVPQPTDGYTFTASSDCKGSNIDYAVTKTCVVVYTADPPDPPAIELQQNIDIDSWVEQ